MGFREPGSRPSPQEPQEATSLLPRRYVRTATTSISLGCQNLVVHRPQIHAMASPRVDVIGKGDGVVASEPSLRRSDTPELHEGSVALNVRPVPVHLVYVVSATVTVHSAQRLRTAARWLKIAPAIDDVVLDKWVCRPPIKTQICISTRREVASVVADDSAGRSGIPAFTGNHIAAGTETPSCTVIATTVITGHGHAC